MKLKILKEKNETMEIEIEGERHGFPNALVSSLQSDSSVELAAYKVEHPLIGNPKIIIKVKKGKDPRQALKAAAESLSKDLKEFDKKFTDEFK